MNREPIPAWDRQDLGVLFELDALAPRHFRNRWGDANFHDRAYGGQILGQALLAAARTVEPGRVFTTMQFLFLQGTQPAQPIDLTVDVLQDGKRFSSRHVRGVQGESRSVLDAQLTFAHAIDAPSHGIAIDAVARTEDPDRLPAVTDLPPEWGRDLQRSCGYRFAVRPALDFRLPDPPVGLRLDVRAPHLRFWIKVRRPLGDDPNLHSAAFAYVSDWWLNYTSLGGHVQPLLDEGRALYVASLNHAIWQHRSLRADGWLHFDVSSPSADAGRSLTVAQVHDRAGRLVATVTQECVMVPRES